MTNSNVQEAIKKTVQSFPSGDGFQFAYNNQWVLNLATVADGFTPWGQDVRRRDIELRNFFPTEPILAGAVAKVSARNAAQSVKFDGPPRTVKAVQEMWNLVNYGKGPQHLLMQVSQDLYTQDNGAMIEIIRQADKENSPVVSLAHRDPAQCIRTGNPEQPVTYIDPRNGSQHKLLYYHILTLEEMPSSIETMNSVQYCALTRIFRAAQIMRDLNILDAEKVGGRHTRRIIMVSGVAQSLIDDSQTKAQNKATNEGLLRYIQPVILASLDPTATPAKIEIDLASAPDGFDRQQAFMQYIATLALGFLDDYQMFAPLPAGNLGTSTQSEVLARKSRGTGPALFNKLLVRALSDSGVFPNSVEFSIEEKDSKQEQDDAAVKQTRAATRAARIASTEITPAVARQIAVDDGDLQQEYLHVMGEEDVTDDVTVTDDERAETEEETAANVDPLAVAQANAATPVATKQGNPHHDTGTGQFASGGGAVPNLYEEVSSHAKGGVKRTDESRQSLPPPALSDLLNTAPEHQHIFERGSTMSSIIVNHAPNKSGQPVPRKGRTYIGIQSPGSFRYASVPNEKLNEVLADAKKIGAEYRGKFKREHKKFIELPTNPIKEALASLRLAVKALGFKTGSQ